MSSFSAVARAHATQPMNYGPLMESDGNARITGPCGDTMEFWLSVEEHKVAHAGFVTDGCCTSLACGSMAVSLAEGRLISDVLKLQQQDILEALSGFPTEFEHCALLAVNTLKAACTDYLQRKQVLERIEHDLANDGRASEQRTCPHTARRPDDDVQEKDEELLQSKMCRIGHKILVVSGKGGVGKSTLAVNLAVALMLAGERVGLLDIDIHGPSVPIMLGLEREAITGSDEGLVPVELGSMKIMSLGFLLSNPDDAVIWRGPMKIGVIKQFLMDVAWGDLDYLIIDAPPGTGDEPLTICQLLEDLDGAVIVTTPQRVAAADVRKSITFCRQLGVPVLGIVENMSGFVCPECGKLTQILPGGAGMRLAEEMQVRFLGAIPIDPAIAEACDTGRAFIHRFADSPAAKIMQVIVKQLVTQEKPAGHLSEEIKKQQEEIKLMRIAIPMADGKLTMHFGHCESFALLEVDVDQKLLLKREDITAPPHEPGLLPKWLAERGVNLVLAGGMGARAQGLFEQHGIAVIVGVPSDTPERLVEAYLAGTLCAGENVCDH